MVLRFLSSYAQVKRILDCLFDAQRPLRGQEILELTGIVVTERNLQAALSKEPRVRAAYESMTEAPNGSRALTAATKLSFGSC